MKNIKQHITQLAIMSAVLFSTGCASTFAYKHNQEAAVAAYAYSSGDKEVITAYQNGDVRGVMFELTAIDTIFRSPGSAGIQLVGALVDAALLYGTYEILDDVSSSSSSSSSAGRDSVNITVNGDGNDTNYSNSQGSTVAPSVQ